MEIVRLVKLANEYNVGLAHLAEFLQKQGIDVQPTPAAKVDVSEALRTKLNKHYQTDIAAKKDADKLINRPVSPPKPERPVAPPAPPPPPVGAVVQEAPKPVPPPVVAVVETPKTVEAPKPVVETKEDAPKAVEKPAPNAEEKPANSQPQNNASPKKEGERPAVKQNEQKSDRPSQEQKPQASREQNPQNNNNKGNRDNRNNSSKDNNNDNRNNNQKDGNRNNISKDNNNNNNNRNNQKDGQNANPNRGGNRNADKAIDLGTIQQLRTQVVVTVETPTQKPQGPKVLGKINLDRVEKDLTPEERKKRERDRRERERKERSTVEKQQRAALEQQQREIDKQKEEIKRQQDEIARQKAIDEKRVQDEASVIKATDSAKAYQLRGTKVLGKIELPVEPPKQTAEDKKKKRKRKKVAVGGTVETLGVLMTDGTRERPAGQANSGNNNNRQGGNNQNRPAGQGGQGGNNQNRPAGQGGQGGNNQNRPAGQGGQGGNNQNRPAGQGGNNRNNNNNRNATPAAKPGGAPTEVSKKDVADRIRTAQAAMSGAGKNKRQNLRRDKRDKHRERQEAEDAAAENHGELQVTEFVSANELANLMDVQVMEIITTCVDLGYMVTINQRLDAELISVIASEFGFTAKFENTKEEEEDDDELFEDDPADVIQRAPIVTVMGHVDHGKTSLLDFIHKQNIMTGEAGGITQHLGAYEAYVGEGSERRKITFLDTPGHEAFTAMRARGAKVTDVAIIIIAADDGIMPTTREAISHAQAANVPMVFAYNKIDKENANVEKIREQLASMNLLPEEWGGKYQTQEIAAKKGIGVADLLEKICLEADILDVKANAKRPAIGTILEASLDKGRGYVAKILVQNGTLRKGDIVLAGQHWGRVRNMFDEHNKSVKEAGPSTPVLVLGLSGAPQAGDIFKVYTDESKAREIAGKRSQIMRNQAIRSHKRISLDDIGRRLALGSFKELKLIIKGDFDGSVEALSDSLQRLGTEQVKVSIVHRAVGAITESDVNLASASDAIIIGFQVRPVGSARQKAEQEGVQIKTYSIIYEVIEEIKAAIEGMLEPTKEEKIVCTAEVRATFPVKRIGTVIGAFMQDGKITRNTKIRVIRDNIVIFPVKENQVGELGSLKRFTEDVREVARGYEFGMTIKDFNDIKEGDTIEGYEIIEVKQKLGK